MPQLEPLNLRITGNSSGLSATLGKSGQEISGFADRVSSRLSGLAAPITAALGGLSAGSFAGFGLKAAAEVEVVSAKFTALTGSVEASASVVKQLRDLAAETPLSFAGVSKASTTLLAYNTSAADLIPTLKLLGDVSLGDQEKLERLAIAFGQVQAKGKLMAQEVNQMVENGFNPLVEIGRTTGQTMTQLYKRMEAGEITFQMVVDSFRSATSEGGRFFNALELQGQTLTGRLTQLQDKFTQLAAKVGEALLPAAKSAVDGVTDLVEWLGSLDASTVETTAKIGAFAASFAVAVAIIPKVIVLGKELVLVIRSIATAQSVAQALAGPKGWATLAAGLAAAGAAVYGVDKLFDNLAENQTNSAVASTEAAKGLSEIEKRAVESTEAIAGLTKEQEQWQRQAATIRDRLATPEESYRKSIEDLALAVSEGGLEFEFFARGVGKAFDELERANGLDDFKLPKAVLAGSQADILATLNPVGRKQEQLANDRRDAIRDEVAALRQRLADKEQEASKQAESQTVLAIKDTNTKLDALKAAILETKSKTQPVNL